MKKHIVLYTLTGLAIAAIFLLGDAAKRSFVKVSTVKLALSTAQNTVICMGKVEAAGDSKVYAHSPGLVQKVYVRQGEKVSAGQPLLMIHPIEDVQDNLVSQAASTADGSALAKEIYAAYLNGTSSIENSSSTVQSASGTQDYVIHAEISGIVESLPVVNEGSYLSADTPAAIIRADNSLRVRLSVAESQIGGLKEGQSVRITGAGFRNETYTGSIFSISPEAKQIVSATGQETVVEVLATVNHPGSDLRPGYTATVKISTSQGGRQLVVPYEAVREDTSNQEYVFCVRGNSAKKTYIQTGQELDQGFEVTKGVQVHDVVIMDPDDVKDNSKIIPVSTAAGESNENDH